VHQKTFHLRVEIGQAEQERERVEEPKKGPLQCWGCGEAHMLRDFPHRKHEKKESIMFRRLLWSMMWPEVCPRIYAAMEN
jgi:hypothetical protein